MWQGPARLGSARVGSADAPWHLFNGRRLALDFLIRLAGGKVLVEELKGDRRGGCEPMLPFKQTRLY
jgi:hypothetical protein